jgi:hypothetical protein
MSVVLTVDQQRSRSGPDLVEAALARLRGVRTTRAFERTAGDEFQGVLDDPVSVVTAILDLMQDGHWSVGVGIGAVERPLPTSTRAGRGPAFTLARQAVEAAKRHPRHVVVQATDVEGGEAVGAVLGLLGAVYSGRTPQAWEAVELIRTGMSATSAAQKLGITRQAVSQRLSAAHWPEERAAVPTLERLIERADTAATTGTGTTGTEASSTRPPASAGGR